jgi:hypothetical protein
MIESIKADKTTPPVESFPGALRIQSFVKIVAIIAPPL